MQVVITLDVPEWVCKTLRVEDNTEAHAWVNSMVARITPELVWGLEPAPMGVPLSSRFESAGTMENGEITSFTSLDAWEEMWTANYRPSE